MDKVKEYVRTRNLAVWSCNVNEFKFWARRNGVDLPAGWPDELYEGLMAKMAMNITTTPESVKTWARGILNNLGWSESLG